MKTKGRSAALHNHNTFGKCHEPNGVSRWLLIGTHEFCFADWKKDKQI